MKKSLILRQVKGVEVGCDLKQQTVSKGKDKKDKKGILNVEYEEKLIFFFKSILELFQIKHRYWFEWSLRVCVSLLHRSDCWTRTWMPCWSSHSSAWRVWTKPLLCLLPSGIMVLKYSNTFIQQISSSEDHSSFPTSLRRTVALTSNHVLLISGKDKHAETWDDHN